MDTARGPLRPSGALVSLMVYCKVFLCRTIPGKCGWNVGFVFEMRKKLDYVRREGLACRVVSVQWVVIFGKGF